MSSESKFDWKLFVISLLLGWTGADRFYVGKIGTGILKLITAGGFAIGYFVDLFFIATGKFKNANGEVVCERNQIAIYIASCVTCVIFGFGPVLNIISILQKPQAAKSSIVYGDPVAYGGEVYETIVIGTQTWLKRNLNYELKEGSLCYDNNPANCQKYGRLYNWLKANEVCPKGWHLPSKEEWDALKAIVGWKETGGKYLKDKSGWSALDNGESGNGLDTYGFAALPGGTCNLLLNNCGTIGKFGYWWSATEYNPMEADFMFMMNDDVKAISLDSNIAVNDKVAKHPRNQLNSYSVRCVKD